MGIFQEGSYNQNVHCSYINVINTKAYDTFLAARSSVGKINITFLFSSYIPESKNDLIF